MTLFASASLLLSATLLLSVDTVVLRNGNTVEGKFIRGDSRTVTLVEGSRTVIIPVGEIDMIHFGGSGTPPIKQGEQAHAEIVSSPPLTLSAGTDIVVRLSEAFDSKIGTVGQEYRAVVDEPVVQNEIPVIPKGTPISVMLVQAKQAGKLEGSAVLTLALSRLDLNGHSLTLKTDPVVSQGEGKGKQSAIVIGGSAASGALIGGLLGRGGLGAARGAAAGAAAGTAVQALRPKPGVKIPAETRLTFKLAAPVSIR